MTLTNAVHLQGLHHSMELTGEDSRPTLAPVDSILSGGSRSVPPRLKKAAAYLESPLVLIRTTH